MAGRESSVWRLPWRPWTHEWMKNMLSLAGAAPLGDDPLSGCLAFLLVLPLLLLTPFWVAEWLLVVVLWPFVAAGRGVGRVMAG